MRLTHSTVSSLAIVKKFLCRRFADVSYFCQDKPQDLIFIETAFADMSLKAIVCVLSKKKKSEKNKGKHGIRDEA